jgi:hypothetical protein
MKLTAIWVLSLACLIGVAAHAQDGPSPDPAATSAALRNLLAMAHQPIPKTSTCWADYGQRGAARVADLLAVRLSSLYAGDNKIAGACSTRACNVTMTHSAGEDVASTTVEFELKRGAPVAASLRCTMTP